MSRLLERLLIWFADLLDRSIVMVPEVDDEWPPLLGRSGETRPSPRHLVPQAGGHQAHSSARNSSSSEGHDNR